MEENLILILNPQDLQVYQGGKGGRKQFKFNLNYRGAECTATVYPNKTVNINITTKNRTPIYRNKNDEDIREEREQSKRLRSLVRDILSKTDYLDDRFIAIRNQWGKNINYDITLLINTTNKEIDLAPKIRALMKIFVERIERMDSGRTLCGFLDYVPF